MRVKRRGPEQDLDEERGQIQQIGVRSNLVGSEMSSRTYPVGPVVFLVLEGIFKSPFNTSAHEGKQ